MRIFGTLVIWGWIKPYLELSDFPENWYGKSLQHILNAKKVFAAASAAGADVTAKIDFCCYGGVGGGLTSVKTFFASRICCKDSPYQFSFIKFYYTQFPSEIVQFSIIQLRIVAILAQGTTTTTCFVHFHGLFSTKNYRTCFLKIPGDLYCNQLSENMFKVCVSWT